MILIWHKLTASDFLFGLSAPVPVSRLSAHNDYMFIFRFLPFIEFITIVFYTYFRTEEQPGDGNDVARAPCTAPQQSKKLFTLHKTSFYFSF